MTTRVLRRLLPALLLIAATSVAAQQAYVKDELEITLRSGESTGHSIVRMLPSGTPLDVLSGNEESGYTKVRTPQGTEGFVLSRFLTNEPIARDKLAQATRRLAFLNEEKRRLDDEIASLKASLTSENGQRASLETQVSELSTQLQEIRRTASSTLAIADENKTLRRELQAASASIASLEQDNELLRDERARKWFIIGGAVVIAGVLIGLILPRIRWRRRSSWDSL